MVADIMNSIGGLMNLGSNIAGMWDKPAGEKSKRRIEQNMRDIYDAWRNGDVDPDVAISAIQAQLQSMVGHEDADQISQMRAFAMSFITDIVAQRNAGITAAWGEQPTGPGSSIVSDINRDSYGQGGVGGGGGFQPSSERTNLTGSPEFQKERGQALMRNLLMNTESGQAFGKDTGLDRLTAPRANPTDLFQQNRGNIKPPIPVEDQNRLGSKIEETMNKLGGY